MKRVPIYNYEGLYEVDEDGNIHSLSRPVLFKDKIGQSTVRHTKDKILKPSVNGNGYAQVRLCKNSSYKVITVHRIVASSFIDNCDNKPEINHKDGNKTNNKVSNLEWCTSSENQKHAYKMGLQKPNKTALGKKGFDSTRGIAVGLYDVNGNLLEKYGSILQAAEAKSIDSRTLNRHVKRDNKIKTLWRIL